MVLHTLNASPSSAAFDSCIPVLRQSDAIILMGDGVYCALAGTASISRLLESTAQIYVLHDDAAAAGVLESLGEVAIIEMDGFAELSERYTRQLAWF